MATPQAQEAQEEAEESSAIKAEEFSADRKDLCPPGLATRIHRMVLQSLIPQLHKTLTEKVQWWCWLLLYKDMGGKFVESVPAGASPPPTPFFFKVEIFRPGSAHGGLANCG